jgi:sec-independent protein translocase protein TatA
MHVTPTLAFLSMPGGIEWIIVLVVALLLFGRRLPDVMRSLGSSAREFKKGLEDGIDGKEDVADAAQKTRELPKQEDAPGTAAREHTADHSAAPAADRGRDQMPGEEPRSRDL